jgi:hypothetical protein
MSRLQNAVQQLKSKNQPILDNADRSLGLLRESDTTRAFDMETSIVSSANKTPHKSKLIKKQASDNVVKFLKTKGITGKGQMPRNSYPTNPKKWDKYFPGGKVSGGTKTPKTDLMVGKTRISLKTGPAQLTSGGRGEALALFMNAIEKSGKKPDAFVKKIRDNIGNIAPSTVSSVQGNVRELLKSKKDEVLEKANKVNQDLKQDIRKLFATGSDVAFNFTQEAMSGEIKFTGSEAYANYILVTDFDGKNNALHKTNDKKYISKVASQVKPEVRFKTTSEKKAGGKTGFYRYWGVVSLITEDIVNTEFELLQEQLIQEGLLDSIFSKGKQILSKINDAIQKIKDKIIAFFQKAIDYLKEGWHNILEFFDMTADISYKNNINW